MPERATPQSEADGSLTRPLPSAAPAPAVAGRAARGAGPSTAEALGLQRAVGNRSASRVLSRWAAHPDKDKKGQFMTDGMAADWNRFNPPLSK
ncbi:MAG: hypothetical protein ACLP01_13435 [Solirubrobacteraceae bacterium]